MMNTRCTKPSMVRDDSQSSKTSNKKCPVDLHGDHIIFSVKNVLVFQSLLLAKKNKHTTCCKRFKMSISANNNS